jgi:hypothetical protein
MARQFQGRGLPQVQRQHRPSTLYHELSSRCRIVRRGRRHDGQVLHHCPRRPSPNLVHQVAPLSIDSWRSLRDKFLLNFQGYCPDTDALAELSLYKQLEKETLREYYCKFLTLKSQLPSVDDQLAIHYAISGLRAGVLYSHCIRDPPKNLQELYQLFEKYARSEELHQRKVESQRKPKDPPQSSRTWTRPSQSDSGRDSRSQQQVHNITNQHPAGEAPRRQDYPSKAAAMARVFGVEDGHSSRVDFTTCFTAKTARTRRGTARKRRPPGTRCPEHNPPTTQELSPIHINTTSHNHTTTTPLSIHLTTHINNTRRYKSYHLRSSLRTHISQTSTTQITPKHQRKKTSADKPYRGVIHMITGGSSVDFDTKRQKRDHYQSINHIAVTGPIVQTKWSHVSLTFDARDVDLRSAPHMDAMVINCSVAGWDLHKVLVDNGSQADIIFLHAFDCMVISHSLLKPSDNPLYGFGGKGTFPVGKIELPLSFGVAPNARSEQVTSTSSTWYTHTTP